MAANCNPHTSRPDIRAIYAHNIESLCHKSEELLQYLTSNGMEEAYVQVRATSVVSQKLINRLSAVL